MLIADVWWSWPRNLLKSPAPVSVSSPTQSMLRYILCHLRISNYSHLNSSSAGTVLIVHIIIYHTFLSSWRMSWYFVPSWLYLRILLYALKGIAQKNNNNNEMAFRSGDIWYFSLRIERTASLKIANISLSIYLSLVVLPNSLRLVFSEKKSRMFFI